MSPRAATDPRRIGGSRLGRRVRDILHMPPGQALARLGYDLKQPVFALPFYRFSLPVFTPLSLAVTPSDPWPGDARHGADILADAFAFAGRRIATPAPPWAPLGAEAAWVAELHGFAWLRDLRAVGGDAARRRARDLAGAWLRAHEAWSAHAWDPLTTGRRLSHWLGCYEFFAASAEISFRHRLLGSMTRQAQHLCRVLPAGLSGADLIAALKGLIFAGVCLPEGSAWRERGLAILRRELPKQILADGVHAERNPSRHLAVLRDLIDLRAVLHKGETPAESRDAPVGVQAAIEAMAPALGLFQHGDGRLALFNGSCEEEDWQVDMVLQRAGGRPRPVPSARESGFYRLCAGRTVVVVDAAAPPPPGVDRRAHAGTLSLEVSIGRERLIVNCGARADDSAWLSAQRATAAHSTLTVADTNSSRLLPAGGLGRRARVHRQRPSEADGNLWLDMSHDGYQRAFAVQHRRRLYLSADGADLRGEDRLEPTGAARPADFAIRFHVHPDVRASLAQGGDSALLRLAKGGGWQLRASGAQISLESSVYVGRKGEIRRTLQIVFSGRSGPDGALVKWALRRIEPRSE